MNTTSIRYQPFQNFLPHSAFPGDMPPSSFATAHPLYAPSALGTALPTTAYTQFPTHPTLPVTADLPPRSTFASETPSSFLTSTHSTTLPLTNVNTFNTTLPATSYYQAPTESLFTNLPSTSAIPTTIPIDMKPSTLLEPTTNSLVASKRLPTTASANTPTRRSFFGSSTNTPTRRSFFGSSTNTPTRQNRTGPVLTAYTGPSDLAALRSTIDKHVTNPEKVPVMSYTPKGSQSRSGTIVFRPRCANFDKKLLTDTMDLSCKIKIGRHNGKTSTAYSEGNVSVWPDQIALPRKRGEEFAELKIKQGDIVVFYDKLGGTLINLNDIVSQGKVSRWYTLRSGAEVTGEILIDSEFYPN